RLNEGKSRIVDLARGEAFGFLGFDFRSRRGVWRPEGTPQIKQRTALLRKMREGFERWRSQTMGPGIVTIKPILRGWVQYFRVGNSSRCLAYVKRWVEQRVRRHLMRARGRPGLGWKRWSTAWLYSGLGLYRDYRVRYWGLPERAPSS